MEIIFSALEYVMLVGIVLLLSLQDITRGQELGPRYKTVLRFCTSDLNCDRSAGESCWILFSGCKKGQCMCNPRAQFKDENGACRNLKLGDDECIHLDRCPEGMTCVNQVCSCPNGSEMTEDKRMCLRNYEKFLGESCNYLNDVCYQKLGNDYKRSEIHCEPSEGVCRCEKGFKEENGACVKWNIGEYGCTRAHHCQGGAVCIDNSCQCPSGYRAAANNKKCARDGSIYDLEMGDYCNETGERRYCGSGLICNKCPGDRSYKCAQYLQQQQWRHVSHSNSIHTLPGSGNILLVTLAVTSVLSVLHCCHL